MFIKHLNEGKKHDLGDFDYDMVVCARQGGVSISETCEILRLHTQQSLEFT